MRLIYLLCIANIVLAGLSSCTFGPDFQRPPAPDAKHYSPQKVFDKTASAPGLLGDQQVFNTNATIPFDWWTLFQSEQINSLIERALKNNPDIESAQASLREAQEYANAQRGILFPSLSLSYMPSRNKIAGNLSSSAPGPQANGDVIQQPSPQPTYYNFHVTQLNVGFVPDVFGLSRRQIESADALVAIQKFQLEAAHITLASNVFAVAVQQAMLRTQIDTATKMLDINQQQITILNSQFKHGLVSLADVAAQENLLASAQQALIPLELQLQKNRNLLAALLGNLPDQEVSEVIDLAALHLPLELPMTLPSTLVEQRPDVRAAEEQLHYASAQAGVAIANRLPLFNITAAIGGMADTPAWMFKSGGSFFNLSADISQVIFDGGALRAKSRAAQAALIRAGAQYRGTVITAVQNVADTLFTLQSDAENVKASAGSARASENIFKINQKQYEHGAINYQTLLASQQAYESSLLNLTQAQAARLIDTAGLYQALGGGWWSRQTSAGAVDKISAINRSTTQTQPISK
jgi:NodT family efflux transporter outer membrane factor (OMF) lipoprotein